MRLNRGIHHLIEGSTTLRDRQPTIGTNHSRRQATTTVRLRGRLSPTAIVDCWHARAKRVVVCAVAVILLAGLGLPVFASPIGAQEDAGVVRVAARQLASGKVEFALQRHDGDAWGERLLPARRLFPADATVGRWLVSSPVSSGSATLRVAARRLSNGKVEFALQRHDGDAWGERLLPARRLFPADATVGRWLVSSPVTPRAPGDDTNQGGSLSRQIAKRAGDYAAASRRRVLRRQ